MSILEIIGMGINNEQTSWSPVHTTQQLGIYPITWGLHSLTTSPKFSSPPYCPTCSFGSGTSHSGFTGFNPLELSRGAVEPLNRG